MMLKLLSWPEEFTGIKTNTRITEKYNQKNKGLKKMNFQIL